MTIEFRRVHALDFCYACLILASQLNARRIFKDIGTLGQVVNAFAATVGNAGFRLYWGDNAEEQAPDMGGPLAA